MKKAIYPGSFDPITNGHLDIIRRAASLWDTVIVTVLPNSSKDPLFTLEERVWLIKKVVAEYSNVQVESFDGLLVSFAQQMNAQSIIKGLRTVSDFEYEMRMAQMNRCLNSCIETVFMMTESQNAFLSSSLVKEVAKLNGSIHGLVPSVVEKEMVSRMNDHESITGEA